VPAGIVGTLSGMHSGCTGNEDLRVYLGETPPEVQKLMVQFVDPYAFVAVTSTESDRNWNQGFLWVAPPGAVYPSRNIPTWNLASPGSTAYGAFKYLMLHEVGHIFGNSHIDDTVMETNIAYTLESWTNPALPNGPSADQLAIDGRLEVLPNMNLADDYTLATTYGCVTTPSGAPQCPDQNALATAFERIFGRKPPSGTLSATAHRIANPSHMPHDRPDTTYSGTGSLQVTFTDSNGKQYSAKVTTFAKISEKNESGVLFNNQHDDHYNSFAISFSGVIQAQGHKKIPVIVNYNMGDRLDVIDFTKGGIDHPLLQVQN
jgi:hypothetical protein